MKRRYIMLTILLIIFLFGMFAFVKTFGKKDGTIKEMFKQTKYAEYKAGDIVSFNEQEWYVLHDSSKNDNYVTLIYKGVIYLGDQGIDDADFNVYESSDLNKYLKNDYVNELGSKKLREVNGYKVRLFNSDDFKVLNVKYDSNTDSYDISECPDYICLTNVYYSTMIPTNDGNYDVTDEDSEEKAHLKYYVLNTTYDSFKLESIVDDSSLFVRPVINVYKENING